MSVVCCSYNGAATIGETLAHVGRLDYPDFEVIVVDDGSTNGVSRIAAQYPVRLITQANQGLSAARNAGLHAATGEVVAYIDDDAYPDPHWLTYLVRKLNSGDCNGTPFVGAGGPNLHVPTDGESAECVAHAPGGPTHVLLDDTVAEHIPGCNMAFRRDALLAIGGFDPQFRIAGDDVDICWRLQAAGGVIAFSPTAQVWHHRRGGVRPFWRQQFNYGRAEADLERKWPDKYNPVGHATWAGRVYGKGVQQLILGSRRRIYHGVWGEALFQQVYHVPPSLLASLPMMPEWYVAAGRAVRPVRCWAGSGGRCWPPIPLLAARRRPGLDAGHRPRPPGRACCPAGRRGHRGPDAGPHRGPVPRPAAGPLPRPVPTGADPVATPRRRRVVGPPVRYDRDREEDAGRCPPTGSRLAERDLRTGGATVLRGSDFDRWDLELRGGLSAAVRAKVMTEDLGDEKQLVRWQFAPRCSRLSLLTMGLALTVATAAFAQHHHLLAYAFAAVARGRSGAAGPRRRGRHGHVPPRLLHAARPPRASDDPRPRPGPPVVPRPLARLGC